MESSAEIARRLILPLREDIIRLLSRLVQINTTAIPPNGAEAAGQQELAAFLTRFGLQPRLYPTDFLADASHPYVRPCRDYSNRPNLICSIEGEGGGRSLLLSGHIDTVPPNRHGWSVDPFGAEVKDGKLYGRGAWDMKSGLAAQAGAIAALGLAGKRLRGNLLFESVVDEEWAGGGGTLAARLSGFTADACVISEGTGLEVVRATRGGAFIDICCRAGDPANYFSRDEVTSPAIALGRLLGWIDEWRLRRKSIDRGDAYREFPDPAPLQVLAVESNRFESDVPWSVPLEAKVKLYLQFLPHEDVEAELATIERSFAQFCSSDPFFKTHRPEWTYIVNPSLHGHELDKNHPWTQTLHSAAVAVLQRQVPISAAEYPCDAFLIQNEFNIPTLVFGPAGAGAHNADEHVVIDTVIQTAEVLLAAAIDWCGGDITEHGHRKE